MKQRGEILIVEDCGDDSVGIPSNRIVINFGYKVFEDNADKDNRINFKNDFIKLLEDWEIILIKPFNIWFNDECPMCGSTLGEDDKCHVKTCIGSDEFHEDEKE